MSNVYFRTGVALGLLWVAHGCAGGDGASDGGGSGAAGSAGAMTIATAGGGATGLDAVSFELSIQPKLNEACNCHQSTPILMAPFTLKPGEAYDALVGVPSVQLPSMLRVKPGSLNESYLWHKINGTQAEVGGSGMIMPFTIPLRPDERDLFGRWIASGAQR